MFRAVAPTLAGVTVLAVALSGCAVLWDGEWEEDGHRRIYLYEVEAGDTLTRIAWRHGLTVEQLQEWNQLERPDELSIGQHLVLNPPGDQAPPGTEETAAADDETRDPPPPPDDPPDYQLDWQWPTEGEVKRAYATDSGGKSGIQIGGEEGAAIRAASDGEVVYSGSGLRGYGNLIIIMHDERFISAYGYNRELLVSEGEQVQGGDRIAEMGVAPGAEQPSLHFEIRIDGDAVDPEEYLPAR